MKSGAGWVGLGGSAPIVGAIDSVAALALSSRSRTAERRDPHRRMLDHSAGRHGRPLLDDNIAGNAEGPQLL